MRCPMSPTKTILISLLAAMLLAVPALANEDAHEEAHGEEADAASTDAVIGPDQLPGENWTHTFTTAGAFEYHCHPHPWMIAGITVLSSDGSPAENHTVRIVEPAGGDPEAWAFEPSDLTIRVGDSVTWVNEGNVMHKVRQMTADHQHGAGAAPEEGGHAEDEHVDDEHATDDQTAPLAIGGKSLAAGGIGSTVAASLIGFLAGATVVGLGRAGDRRG